MEPEVRELRTLLAIARLGSVSAAARELDLTQPAVSMQLAKLEQTVGYPLFYRGGEGVVLTEEGKALLPRAVEVTRQYDDLLRRTAYWSRARERRVRIWWDGSRWMDVVRSELEGDSPRNVALEWCSAGEASWIEGLRDFQVDLAVAGTFFKAAALPELRSDVVYRDRGLTVIWNPQHDDLGGDPFEFPGVFRVPAIVPSNVLAYGFRDFLEWWCGEFYGMPPLSVIECQSEQELLDAGRLGLGAIFYPGDAVSRLGLCPVEWAWQREFVSLLPGAFTYGVRSRAGDEHARVAAEWQARRLGLVWKRQLGPAHSG